MSDTAENRPIFSVDAEAIKISSDELWSHTALIKGFVPQIDVNDIMRLVPMEVKPIGEIELTSFTIAGFHWDYLRILLRHRQHKRDVFTFFWISEILTRGGVFLHDKDDILLWLLNERDYTITQ